MPLTMTAEREAEIRAAPSGWHTSVAVQEFAFRLNQGNVANHTFQRLDSFVDAIVGKRLTYARLIARVPA